MEIPQCYKFFKADQISIAIEVTAYSYQQAVLDLTFALRIPKESIGKDWILYSPKNVDLAIDK